MRNTLKCFLIMLALVAMPAYAESKADKVVDYMPSLITATPLEGRMLAIKIVRKTIGAIQKSPEIKQKVREAYQDDARLLMQAAELVAIEFGTIALANNYWR